MTLVNDVPTIDTVGDLIALLQTVPATSKFRAPAGLHLMRTNDGTILLDDGVVKS